MPTDLLARVRILDGNKQTDGKLLAKLVELKKGRTLEDILELLGVSEATYYHLRKTGKSSYIPTIPYELYIKIFGKEPESNMIEWEESPDLARRIARWYKYFTNSRVKDVCTVVAEKAKGEYSLEYSTNHVLRILFTEDITFVNPVITDIVASLFNDQLSERRRYSLDEIEELTLFFDTNFDEAYHGGRNPDKVSWVIAEPVVDELISFMGRNFNSLFGYVRRSELCSGVKKLNITQYHQLKAQLQGRVQARLIEVLRNAINVLIGIDLSDLESRTIQTIAALTKGEVELVKEGMQNYGKDAFMKHVFPQYFTIRQGYGFPIKLFEVVIEFAEKERTKRKGKVEGPQPEILARAVGKQLQSYKAAILDVNRDRGNNIGVTFDGIKSRLSEAAELIKEYRTSHMLDIKHGIAYDKAN